MQLEGLERSFDFLNIEDLVLVDFLVERELASLSEGHATPFLRAFEGLLASVNVGVFLEVLAQSKLFQTNHALV